TVGDLNGAMADLNHAVASEPRNPMAYNNRGATRLAAGDFVGALEDYNKAILLDPENALAYVNRGLALLEHGNVAEADADLKRGLAIAPAMRPAIEQLLRRENERSVKRASQQK